MSYSCPVTFEQINSNMSRMSSMFVSMLVVAYLMSMSPFILFFLFIDFLIRLYSKKEFSPIFQMAKFVVLLLKIEDKFCDGGAKRLAAYFGLVFVFMLIITHFLNMSTLSFVLAGVFMGCSLLDAFFNYCLGCKVYYIIKKIFPEFMSIK